MRITRSAKGKVMIFDAYSGGLWAMSSEKWVAGNSLGTHITWILDQVEPVRDRLSDLYSNGISAKIFCFWLANHDPNIPRSVRLRAKGLGLRIDVDEYSASGKE